MVRANIGYDEIENQKEDTDQEESAIAGKRPGAASVQGLAQLF